MDAIEAADTILCCMKFIEESFSKHNEMQSELDKQLCDLGHKLEFTNIDIQRGYKIAKHMQDVYRERRKVKDEREILDILYNHLINAGVGKKFSVELTAHLRGAKKRKAQLERRTYTPRSEAFKAAAEGEVL